MVERRLLQHDEVTHVTIVEIDRVVMTTAARHFSFVRSTFDQRFGFCQYTERHHCHSHANVRTVVATTRVIPESMYVCCDALLTTPGCSLTLGVLVCRRSHCQEFAEISRPTS